MKKMMLFVVPALAALCSPSLVLADDTTTMQPGNPAQDIHRDQFDLNKDVQDINGDRAEVHQDRENLRIDHNAYLQAVQQFGANSSQAIAAKTTQDEAEVALHTELGDLHTDQAQALRTGQYDLNKDLKDMKDDKAEVHQDRFVLRDANQAYQDAVKQFGPDSTQAQADKANVDKAQMVLHEELGDIHKDAKDIRNDRRDLARIEEQRISELKVEYKQAQKEDQKDQARDLKRQLHDCQRNYDQMARLERHDVEQEAKDEQRDAQKQEEQERAEQQHNSLPPMGQQSLH